MEGDTAATVGQIGGDIALTAIPLSRVGNLGRLGQYSASAGVGAGMGALQPVLGDESRGFNAALGGALGAAG